jgi:hypothetical protein
MTRVVIREAALTELLQSSNGPVAKDLLRKAAQVETQAKRLCPVDTGRLRSSISHELGRDVRGLHARVGSNVVYARRIELGFDGVDSLGRRYSQHPRPYLRAALAQVFGSVRS